MNRKLVTQTDFVRFRAAASVLWAAFPISREVKSEINPPRLSDLTDRHTSQEPRSGVWPVVGPRASADPR